MSLILDIDNIDNIDMLTVNRSEKFNAILSMDFEINTSGKSQGQRLYKNELLKFHNQFGI